MRTMLTGKNMTVSDALKGRLDKKLHKLDRYFDQDDVIAHAVMSVEKNRHILEITIPYEGIVLRAQAANEDMYSSIDEAADKLDRQIRRQRTRIEKRMRSGAFRFDAQAEAPEAEPMLVRTKRFAVKPMDVEEAMMQMDLLGHDFFVFSNADSGEVNVLYKRRDGNFGLIEPDYAADDEAE